MMLQYNVASYADTQEFLVLLAMRMGRLKKGGVPHTTKAARAVLQDWNKSVFAIKKNTRENNPNFKNHSLLQIKLFLLWPA